MKTWIALLPALPLLGACSTSGELPPAEREGGWTRWVCDTQAEVLWRFADDSRDVVDLRIGGDDRVYRLHQAPAGSGAFYSDNVIAFHTKGEEGLVYWVSDDDLIGRGCQAP
ncbi:MliC family protein [Zestomonas thermotolerans]|jgi:membrane-bound inhibitor of C-type lysozyme|uniref:MliC family protein n=1 Tax=Zestomonas thermotolerans TaxID=157784 RepID=UPI00037FCB23|nr:MliC family protein [Pseudomonas thermotolerans]